MASSEESQSQSDSVASSESSEYDDPVATVKVCPINVGQGDAIFLEIQNIDGSLKKFLVDGGRGQEHETKKKKRTGLKPLSNLITTLNRKECIIEANSETRKDRIELDSIVITHPDNDHLGGINKLFKGYSVRGSLITTNVSKVCKCKCAAECTYRNENPGDLNYHCSLDFSLQEHDKVVHPKKIEPDKKTPKSKRNASSILTTVNIPGTDFDYDVVLTGDSFGGIILEKLRLEVKDPSKKKKIGIFQVPHHGSKYSSTIYKNVSDVPKTEGGEKDFFKHCYDFYKKINAKIYLISHGDRYDHPHSEVITGIINAAVDNNRNCSIVVTAMWFDESKIILSKIPDTNWMQNVRIYCFEYHVPFVTLDPQEEPELEDALQRLSFYADDTLEQDEKYQCCVCNDQTDKNGSCTAICVKCQKRAHANGRCTVFNKKTLSTYCCIDCQGCVKCNEATGIRRRDIRCQECGNPFAIHAKCLPYEYTCIQCEPRANN